MDTIKHEQGMKVLRTFCAALDSEEIPYEDKSEELRVEFGGEGIDLPLQFNFSVDTEREIVTLLSPLSFKVKQERIAPVGLAITYINDLFADGCFDLSLTAGRICYRCAYPYCGSLLSEAAFSFMVRFAIYLVNKYNYTLFRISKDEMSIEELIESEQ